MIGTIRRHKVWLWTIIVAATAISLVAYFNPAARSSAGGSQDFILGTNGQPITIDGQRITQQDYQEAAREVTLGYLFNGKRADMSSTQVQLDVYQNLFLYKKQEQLGIKITDEAAATLARRLLGQKGIRSLDDFAEQVLKPQNLDKSDFEEFCRHQLGMQQLLLLTGTSGGLVTSGEAETIYRAQNAEASTLMVYFSLTNYLSQVTNSLEDLEQFYTNYLDHYRVPEKVVVNYVKFDATNYLAAARASNTNLDQTVEEVYRQAGTNLPVGTKTPEEAKAKFKEQILSIQSVKEAERVANAFAQGLDKSGAHPEAIFDAAKQQGLTVKTSAPFDADTGPEDTNLPPSFIQEAFSLTPQLPFSGIVPAEDGVYVLGFKQTIPASIPTFKDVESKVATDAREAKARQLALDEAAKFDALVADQLNVDNGLTVPKDFSSIASDYGHKVEALPPVSLSTTNLPPALEDRVGLNLLKRVAFSTEAGKASKAAPAPDGAFVLYVEKLTQPDASKLKTELPALLSAMRRQRANEAFEMWMNSEITRNQSLAKKMEDLVKDIQGGSAQPATR